MNQPFAGGWRFGMTSNDALAPITQNKGIDPEFLKKVASLGLLADDKKGALDQATQAAPLSGLLDAPGASGWGGDYGSAQSGGKYGGTMTTSEAGNSMREVSPAGASVSLNPSAKSAAGLFSGGPLGALLASLQVQKTAPVYDYVMPGMNGFNSGDYGRSSTEVGPPNAQQAQNIADEFAKAFAGYASGGGAGGFDAGVGGLGVGGSPDGYW